MPDTARREGNMISAHSGLKRSMSRRMSRWGIVLWQLVQVTALPSDPQGENEAQRGKGLGQYHMDGEGKGPDLSVP